MAFLNDSVNEVTSLHALQYHEREIGFIKYVKQLDNVFAFSDLLQCGDFVVKGDSITGMEIFPRHSFGCKYGLCLLVQEVRKNASGKTGSGGISSEGRLRIKISFKDILFEWKVKFRWANSPRARLIKACWSGL